MASNYGFIGGSAPHESQAIDLQRTVNLYPEIIESGTGKGPKALINVPGLARFCMLPTAPVRGLYTLDSRIFAVGGSVLYELGSGGTITARAGGLINDGLPAQMHGNGYGGQLQVGSGGCSGILTLSTNAWTPNVRTDAHRTGFCDGYFLSLDTALSILYSSDLEDGLTWNALAKEPRRSGADSLVAMATLERLIWLWGSQTSEVWYNAGTSPFPFAQFQGGYLEQGIVAKDSVAKCDNSLFWLGTSADGPGTVWRSVGFKAQRVSTHVVARAIASYATISDAVGWSYVDGDHAFYVLAFPSAGACWAYDAATAQWAERAFWDTSTGLWALYKPRCHCAAFGQHLVGDGVTGAIYTLSRTAYTDAGGRPLRRMRVGPYAVAEQKRLFHRGLWLDVETGTAAAPTDIYVNAVLADAPVAYWRLNDASGTAAADLSGKANDLAYVAAPTLGTVGPVAGGATGVTFNGTTQSASAAHQADWNVADHWTVALWVKRARAATQEVLFDAGTGGPLLMINGNTLQANKSGGAALCTGSVTVADTLWHHLVVTKTGPVTRLYLDSVDVTVAGTDQTCTNPSVALTLADAVAGSYAFAGVLADVALFDRALTAAEVTVQYFARQSTVLTAAPVAMLARSDDKGKSWASFTDKTLGAMGDTQTRVEWKRLGSAKQRAYRVDITDPVPVRMADAYLDADGGGGQ